MSSTEGDAGAGSDDTESRVVAVIDRDDADRSVGRVTVRSRRLFHMLGGVVDQSIWSLSNISLIIVTANRSGLEDVGVIGVVLLLYSVVLGMVRAFTGLPLIMRCSAVEAETRRRAGGEAAATAVLLGLGGALLFVTVGVAAGGQLRGPLVAVGVLLPMLMVQDVVRYMWLAQRRAWRAARSDVVWLVFSLVGYPIAISQGWGAVGVAAAWAGGGAVSGLLGVAELRLTVRPRTSLRFLREHWDLTRHHVVEGTLQYSSNIITIFVLGFVASLGAVGQIRLGQSLLGPVRTTMLGVAMAAVPEAVHAALRSAKHLRKEALVVSFGLGALAAFFGILIQVIPDGWGTLVLGDNWPATERIALPLAGGLVALGVCFGPMVGLRSLHQAALIVRCTFKQTVLGVVGFSAGALVGDAMGAAIGGVIAGVVTAFIWWHTFLRASAAIGADGIGGAEELETEALSNALACEDPTLPGLV